MDETVLEMSLLSRRGHFGLSLDVGNPLDMEQMTRTVIERFSRIDLLIACAGIARRSARLLPSPVASLAEEEWDAITRINLTGLFLSNRAVLPVMVRQRSGMIVNVSSSPGGLRGQPFAAAYCASKFAARILTESIAEEVRDYGVIVQTLIPDAVNTPLLHATTLAQRLGRPIPPERVADMVVETVRSARQGALIDAVVAPSRLPEPQETAGDA
jgi:NAD(P)-dependent dehydrogenase (short-subunit alcohol dehydrogenase family)